MTKIQSAGYMVCDNEAIYGVGATADEAWNDFLSTMDRNRTVFVKNGENPLEYYNYCLASDYKIHAASSALIERVNEDGGDFAWRIVNGVACTVEEDEGE